MSRSAELQTLIPDAPDSLIDILDGARGAVEPPNRSEIFGFERFAQHGRSLAETHRADVSARGAGLFFPRLADNIRTLREAQQYIGAQARTGYQVSPAAEWLLDNFHLIESQLKEIHDGLPRRYFRDLPVLIDEPLRGLPRVYSVAWAFVAHTDGAFDEDLLSHFLGAYQQVRELSLGELWALPTTLRVVLVENLRRLAERLATNKAAREIANLVGDRIEAYPVERLDAIVGLLNRRGVGRTFLVQIAQRLQDHHATGLTVYHDWLLARLPDLAAAQVQHPAEQAADNLSVSNAIRSLRLIGNADWPDLVNRVSATMQQLLRSPAFEAERSDTRDATLHEIEKLARRSGRGETEIATTLVELMAGDAGPGNDTPANHWLHGSGRAELLRRLELRENAADLWRAWRQRVALPVYLVTLAGASAALVAWMLLQHSAALPGPQVPLWVSLLAATLMLFPASEAVVAVINRLISESIRPSRLPRLALAHGIPPAHRVMVVIPGMLTHPGAVDELTHRLELHHLANPERNAQFGLLTDWADAPAATLPGDAALLDEAVRQIAALNARHPQPDDDAPRFIVLHRHREFSATEQRWIGRERKRGKLEALIALLAARVPDQPAAGLGGFIDLGAASRVAPDTRYLVTLDGDTQLPPGRLRELVGVAAHPHNQPQVDLATRTVTHGYGILQPRVVTPLPARHDFTLYHWLFAGQCGIDPYSAASSEVYQDVFGEGTFTGKGLLNVAAMHAVLADRLPDGQVLSHDLLEGALARCASVSDITVIEDAPFHADVAASRMHRWTRGDWQLLPFLLRPARYPMRAINRWKMIDNLRRSLVAPMSLALLVLALGSSVVAPLPALGLVLAALIAGPLMGAVAGFAPSRDGIAKLHFYRLAAADLRRAICSGLWLLGQLLQLAMMNLDAVGRALWRMVVSRRHLLEWTTAAAAQASATTRWRAIVRRHRAVPVVALLLWLALLWLAPIWRAPFGSGTAWPVLATLLCAAWAASPVWTWWVSRPRPPRRDASLPPADRAYLEDAARDTWRLFERCVGPADRFLPPDNLQLTPQTLVARRTSPTNIGLYLLSAACARRFGWIGSLDLIARLEATLDSLDTLPRHRGHFLNWIDTESGAALLPMYVSTVDSGNLSGHLLAVAQACAEFAAAPFDAGAARSALAASRQRLLAARAAAEPVLADGPLLQLAELPDPLADARDRPEAFATLLRGAANELAQVLPGDDAALRPDALDEFAWRAADHLATLHSALADAQAASGPADAPQRLLAIAARCEALAWAPDFAFLYHRKRHLFHIGYRVAEQQLDASFYDLLASESRLTSLLAIAKGDVPVDHWAALGRPFYAVGALAGLRSWSGSMFEYLMPTLVLEEPHGSVLRDAGHAAICEQVAFGREQSVPWGISESAYAASDHTLAYQYAPQGVPRLALRRTPPDELVIAPYASALAVQLTPHLAVANLQRLDGLTPRARYGFIEALDFSPGRQGATDGFTRVDTFMAHHQGMSIVAIANVLLDGAPRRWTMANRHVQAVSSLLHERAPREVSVLLAPPPGPSPDGRQRRAPGLLREVVPGLTAVAPTQLLSNGRYSVSLRSNGAGWSRWGRIGLSRWRDDALRDAHGSFFYLRWDRQPQAVSLTQHPAPDPAAHYQATYHADRVCFAATWREIAAQTTVWVAPEDDIEFRQVELRNLGDRTLELELISAFEITLAPPAADESHPAFSNLFLRSTWQPAQQALRFERKPRLPTEPALHAAHFLAENDTAVQQLRVQTDRLHWLGRNRDASQPLAAFAGPAPAATDETGEVALDTGLDPVAAISVRLQLPPRGKIRLTFCTAAADQRATLDAVIDKHRQRGPIERASLMSATLAGIRLRELAVTAESLAAIQTLTSAIVMTLARTRAPDAMTDATTYATTDASAARHPSDVCDRQLLWRFGISGDRPIVLVSAGTPQGMGLLRTLTQALRIWGWSGVACDLVVVNAEPASYLMALQRDAAALRDQFAAQNQGAAVAFHLLRADDLRADELGTLRTLARVHFNADGRPLTHHMQEWTELHETALEERQAVTVTALPVAAGAGARARLSRGRFMPEGGEFRFDVSVFQRPARPWVNVLANPVFGAHLSEAGGGYTWALNSRLNQLTPWSNDPLGDPPGEWFLLQDQRTHELWSVSPSAWADPAATYRVAHGQGYSVVSHRRGDVEVNTAWCVDADAPVKQVRLRIVNRGHRPQRLRVIGIAEWVMGANRADRISTDTGSFTQRLPGPGGGQRLTALTCTQRDRAAGFGDGTAFFAVTGSAGGDAPDWTCDRRECFDARGRLAVPDAFGQRSGPGLDPCAALSTLLTIAAGETAECVFLLGFGATPSEARAVATTAAALPAKQRFELVRSRWDALLGATTVKTPDPLFDAMVNRWLLYQTVACRLWAKAGFYQAGGAFGYRDQLQDAMALAWAHPEMLRAQIVLNASRQFVEGDVQHWWHAPTGAGVRTHFSDDLLWLPHACAHYVECTGDTSLLDETVGFIEGGTIPPGAEDAYYVPTAAATSASIYEHGARAIDRSLTAGAHGLPLMGTGDWNDGMNRVGAEGRGESVWLAWFLCQIVDVYAPLAQARGETARARRWRDAATAWRAALAAQAWDGQWYKRAFFDDGTPLGSQANGECRIDLIAQSWAVISGAAPAASQRMALDALDHHLVDADTGLIKLLTPPLQHQQPSAGYIQAYPPGVRENGGQYSHAGVWALIARAMSGDGDTAYRYFTYLSPAHRSAHATQAEPYAIEPYVMAGDVYTEPPYVGRGGWSWYTGSAAWMHRAAVEHLFGLRQRGDEIGFVPCLPSHWPEAELTLKRGGRSLRVVFSRGAATAHDDGLLRLAPGQMLRWDTLPADTTARLQLDLSTSTSR